MTALDLRSIARALGGEATAGQVLAPGPGHGAIDRSMSVRLSATAPDGFMAFSFAGDDWRDCRDHVRARLGLTRHLDPRRTPQRRVIATRAPVPDDAAKTAHAVAMWSEGVDPRGTIAEAYLASRGLDLGDDVSGRVLRWHPGRGAMLALFRAVDTGEPQAVSRTFLDRDGRKLGRKFLGRVGGAAIMLDPFDAVLGGLHIGEGAETCMAARQLGLRPTWALGSAGAVAAFPILGGVETLTLLAEHDAASAHAVETCAARWHLARREVLINHPTGGKDLNDVLTGPA